MKVDSFIKKIQDLEPYEIQVFFDKRYGGSCPCFSGRKTIDGKTLNVWGRCWRVSDNGQDLHVWGSLALKDIKRIAKEIKKKLDEQEWYGQYTIMGKPKSY